MEEVNNYPEHDIKLLYNIPVTQEDLTIKVKEDLIKYVSGFIAGKHKYGAAEKIVNAIWFAAYERGKEDYKKEQQEELDY